MHALYGIELLLHIISYCARISLQVFAVVPGAHL